MRPIRLASRHTAPFSPLDAFVGQNGASMEAPLAGVGKGFLYPFRVLAGHFRKKSIAPFRAE